MYLACWGSGWVGENKFKIILMLSEKRLFVNSQNFEAAAALSLSGGEVVGRCQQLIHAK